MPTVIDSLVVELGLDARNFDKGQRDAVDRAKRTVNEVEASSKRLDYTAQQSSYTFQNLRNQVVSALAVFTGGRSVVTFGKQLAETDAAAARTGRAFNLSAREVQVWQAVAKSAGGSAESMVGTITGLANNFQQFALTGESSIIPFFRTMGVQITDANGKWRDYKDILGDIAAWAERQTDKGQAGAVMRGAGIDNDTIALLLKGTVAYKAYLDQAERSVNVNKDSADSAERFVSSFGKLGNAVEAFARSLGLFSGGAKFVEDFAAIFERFSKGDFSIRDSRTFKTLRGEATADTWKIGDRGASSSGTPGPAAGGADPFARNASGGYVDPRAAEAAIRARAAARGINPDDAMKVARSEGFDTFQSSVVKNGQRERSWGAFQLYTGGGLGNVFQKQTGLDPSDPKNESATIDFALDHARRNGWYSWNGAKNARMGMWQGIPGPGALPPAGASSSNTKTSTTNIGSITVVTQASDPAGVAGALREEIKRQNMAEQANSGLN